MANNDFESIKEQASLKDYADAKLERRGKSYICPSCASGTHKNATAAFSIEPNGKRWKCFSCGASGDIFDLAGILSGNTDKRAELEEVAAFFTLPLEGKPVSTPQAAKPASPVPSNAPQDYSEGIKREREYISRCAEAMQGSEGESYLIERGFTPLEVQRFKFGYDAQRARVILPWLGKEDYYHVDRDITNVSNHKYEKPKSAEVGSQPYFNRDTLKAEAMFIVEGLLDAYAVLAEGYQATALCSTTNHATTATIQSNRYSGVCIVLTDNDSKGQEAGERLTSELESLGIEAYNAVPEFGEHFASKDCADLFRLDRFEQTSRLKDFLLEVQEKALKQHREAQEERYNAALEKMRAINPIEAIGKIYALEGFREPIPTGFNNVDRILGGGLRAGVTVLGAISSLGKTTLAVQIADNIASSGKPVLFVTIEQSAEEITAKSLSRLMREQGGIPQGVVSTSNLMSPTERARWSMDKTQLLLEVCNRYSVEIAPHMRILEGITQPSVQDIKAVAESMANHDGIAPVIFIDYLQLLAAQDPHDTDKQTTDKNVMSLRQLARDLNTPVFVISSLNRSSYSGAISMDSFKESGAIEYGSDVLLGLQPRGIEEQLEGIAEAKKKGAAARMLRENKNSSERECELKVLKQRAGATPQDGIPLTFVPVSSVFYDEATSRAARVL